MANDIGYCGCGHGSHEQGEPPGAVYVIEGKYVAVVYFNNGACGEHCHHKHQKDMEKFIHLELNGVDKFYNGVAVFFGEVAEFLNSEACIAVGAAMPHDGFDDVASAAVVQAVAMTAANL